MPPNVSFDTLRNAMEESLALYDAIDGFEPDPDARLAIWRGAKEPNMKTALKKLKRAFPDACCQGVFSTFPEKESVNYL